MYKNNKGKLLFLKGKQEENEEPKQTAVREFFEESGYKLSKKDLEKYFEQKTKNKLVGIYISNWENIKNKAQKPKPVEDIVEFVWVNIDLKIANEVTKNQRDIFIQIVNELSKNKYKILRKFL